MNGYVILALAAVAAGGTWAISVARRPWVNCAACKGGGKARGVLFRHAYAECPACGGTGRRPRASIRVLSACGARAMKWGQQRRQS